MSSNPFDNEIPSTSRRQTRHRSTSNRPRVRATEDAEPSIWAARNVEWPIPTALSLVNYQKLQQTSRQAGSQLGIAEQTPSTESKAAAPSGDDQAKTDESYFSGILSRVLSPTVETSGEQEGSSSKEATHALRPPRRGCVATANSWMIAAFEVHGDDPPLRLVSRWNVRRTSGVDQWMALPPPVKGDARIARVFCDPTGCHTFVSARNGEAYYHHSSVRFLQKLAGFGCNADGSRPTSTGISATQAAQEGTTKNSKPASIASKIQQGISTGSYVTAIAWDRERGTEGSSKTVLLGTNSGELYEYSFASPNSTPSDKKSDDSHTQPLLLHQLNSDAAVTGLAFERLRTGILIMCCTSGRDKRTRFYTFYSAHNSSFRMALADESHASLVELPGSVDSAELRICNDQLCMGTATGIYYGTIDRQLTGPAFGGGALMMDSGILPYEESLAPVSLALTPHHMITLSDTNEVRFINRVAQKVIQKERVDWVSQSATSSLDENHMGVGELIMDVRRPDQVWLRKGRNLVHISPTQEDRDVWKFTLSKALDMKVRSSASYDRRGASPLSDDEKAQESVFEQAKLLCTNPSQKAVVTAIRAEYHLSQGRAELSAKYLAQCPSILEPFADSAIRLALPMLGIDDPHSYGRSQPAREALKSNVPLIAYLSDKMRVAKNSNDKMTCTMIGAWLTELHLHQQESGLIGKQGLTGFLTNHVQNMDAKTIMKILSSHDVSAAECALYAASSGDLATAINAALHIGTDSNEGVIDALRILNDAPFELAEPLYYKHALTLLSRIPVLAGKSFLSRYTHGLSPTRLLPALMQYERLRAEKAASRKLSSARGMNPFSSIVKDEGAEEVKTREKIEVDGPHLDLSNGDGVEVEVKVLKLSNTFIDDPNISAKYLEGVIKIGCRSSAIYSFLISLYVKLEDEEPLYKFLSEHLPAAAAVADAARKGGLHGQDGLSGPLDMSYALRAILATGRHFRSAIKLYMGFGMRQQAVELALKVDPSLARELAQDSVEIDERKRLWLMIAKNAAAEGVTIGEVDVVSKVVSVLRDCGPDVLSIEDVLPFLPDFAQIDQIKDEICEALTSYSSKIEAFVKEMNECDQNCDSLRMEIQRLRTHRMEMRADAKCAITNKLALSAGEPFYVFPSGYVVLESALKKEVLPHLNSKQRARVTEIEQEIRSVPRKALQADIRISKLQTELDGLIAAECPLTGSIMVDSIDKGFDGSDEPFELGARRTSNVIAHV